MKRTFFHPSRPAVARVLAVIGAILGGGYSALAQTNVTHNSHLPEEFGSGHLTSPQAIATSPIDFNIYVADSSGKLVAFDQFGNFLTNIGTSSPGTLSAPIGCAVDLHGNVYVGDYGTDQCVEFTGNGTYVQTFNGHSSDISLGQVTGVAVDASNNVYVADDDNSRIVIFSQSGAVISQFSTLQGDGGLAGTVGIALDRGGDLWVADYYYDEFARYSRAGELLATYGRASEVPGPGLFAQPYGLTVDSHTNVYVTDGVLINLQEFNSQGQFEGSIGSAGSGPEQFGPLGGVAVDHLGRVLVSDGTHQRIVVFPAPPSSTNSDIAIRITAPTNGVSLTAPANVTVNVSATDTNGIKQVAFYLNGALTGSTTNPPFTEALTALAAGSYNLSATAMDSFGFTKTSAVVNVTVNNLNTRLIDFDALDTSGGSVGGAVLSNYLAGFGVSLSNVTMGTALEAVNAGSLTGSAGVVAPSAPNIFTQEGLNQPVSFTLRLAAPVQSFGFTRAGLVAGAAGVSHPSWQATILDANGVELGSVGESLIVSATNVPARAFQLTETNIASVRFDSDSQGIAAFSAVLLDNLILNANATTPQLTVALTTSVPANQTIPAPATVTLTANVNNLLSAVYTVNFYAGPTLIGSVGAAPPTFYGGPPTYVWSGVPAGAYVLRAQVVDSSGVTADSTPVTITVGAGGNSQVVNFDALNATRGPVSGTTLSNYLRGFGITVSGNITPGTELSVVNQAVVAGGDAVAASSPPNVVTQTGSTGPASYTLNFATLLTNFGFTRPELLANPFVSHPAWEATAYDAAGVLLAEAGEAVIGSSTNVGARSFTLIGPGIASVQFASQGSGLTTFNAMVADDLVLTENAAGVSFPPAVAITSPAGGLEVTSPINLTVTATAIGSAPIASVSFYTNGGLVGTATSSPYGAQLVNPASGSYALTAVAADNNGLSRTSPPVNLTVFPSPYVLGITVQPVGQTAKLGSSVTFNVTTTVPDLVNCQWFQGSKLLSGQTDSTLTIFPVTEESAGGYTVRVSMGDVTLISSIAQITVAQPPSITQQPVGQAVQSGANVTLTVGAGGTGPFNFQWKLNGSDIPGATNSTFTIPAAQPINSGNYEVIVGNPTAFINSAPAEVVVQPPDTLLQSADDFSNRITINPLLGPAFGNNTTATAELGEPSYDGKTNSGPYNSIWYTWTATFTGVISLTTEGSDFDTIMAVYTGTNLSKLTRIASDDDSGGFFTSLVTFNVAAGTAYQITVDGFNGASGNVVLGIPSGTGFRVLNPLSGVSVPVIATNGQPTNQLVLEGSTVTLNVHATNTTPLTYQWYFEGAPVGVGGTSSSLVITDFEAGSVGPYNVLVANSVGSANSQTASIQIAPHNQAGAGGSSQDKLGDAVDLAGPAPTPTSPGIRTVGGGDSRGYSVSQVFSTVGSTREVGEPDHCGQTGGASQWFIYTAPTNGTLDLNTQGSSFNTILAVYTGPGTSFATLVPVGCGFTTNFQTEGQPNVVLPNVVKGTRYFIVVDGYQGASGMVQLHIGLGDAPSLVSPPVNEFAVAGSNATFSVTAMGSTNFGYQWQFNGANIAKATNATLTVANAQTNAMGSYTVIVSNVVGVVTNAPPATLTLQFAPMITAGPTNATVLLGKPANLAVTVVGVNTRSNPLVYQWFSTNLTGSTPVVKATNASLAFPVSQYTNGGSYFVIVSNSYGAMTSPVATLTVRDTNAPLVAFTSPVNNFSTDGSMVTVTGTATDSHVPVTSVQVQVNGGPPVTATGTVKWTNIVVLVPGTNLIVAQSVDLAGNLSRPETNRVIYLAGSLFILQTNGLGEVRSATGATNGATLVLGRNYTALAISVSNYLFQSWSSGPVGRVLTNRTDGSNLTFLMYTNMVLQANFVTNPFLALAGVYNGLFYPTNEPGVTEESSGYISAAISSNSTGVFTARVLVDGGSNAFSGSFDLTGAASTNLARPGKPVLEVALKLHTNSANVHITGSVSNAGSGVSAAIYAERAGFNAISNPALDYAGEFAMVIPPGSGAPAESPDGFGYAAITNTLGGVSTFGGELADGTPFTWSTTIGQTFGNIPLYLSLYSGKGSLLGWIYITNDPPQNIGTNSWVSWIKPLTGGGLYRAGFTNLILTGIQGSPFTNEIGAPLLNLTNATLTLRNGNLAGGLLVFTNIGTNLASHNTLTNLGGTTTNHLTILINTNNGTTSVTFRPTGSTVDTMAHGVILQNQTNAVGAFQGASESGAFILR